MKQEPVMEQLLPLSAEHMRLAEPTTAALTPTGTWDYLYEPDAESVLSQVLTRWIAIQKDSPGSMYTIPIIA